MYAYGREVRNLNHAYITEHWYGTHNVTLTSGVLKFGKSGKYRITMGCSPDYGVPLTYFIEL